MKAPCTLQVAKYQCPQCRSKSGFVAPTFDQIPEPLRNLSREAAEALSPLEIDVGPITRAKYNTGYRQKVTMIRFRWREQHVLDRIDALKHRADRREAREAYKFLMDSGDSAYADFVTEHDKYLEKNPNADERQRRRRYEFIESVGIECALWPIQFWDVRHTFTYERATDPRRQARENRETLEQVMFPEDRHGQEDIM